MARRSDESHATSVMPLSVFSATWPPSSCTRAFASPRRRSRAEGNAAQSQRPQYVNCAAGLASIPPAGRFSGSGTRTMCPSQTRPVSLDVASAYSPAPPSGRRATVSMHHGIAFAFLGGACADDPAAATEDAMVPFVLLTEASGERKQVTILGSPVYFSSSALSRSSSLRPLCPRPRPIL